MYEAALVTGPKPDGRALKIVGPFTLVVFAAAYAAGQNPEDDPYPDTYPHWVWAGWGQIPHHSGCVVETPNREDNP